jgi:hypothetical protein
MKIKLLINVPVSEKYGLTEGKVFDTVPEEEVKDKSTKVCWWIDIKGEQVGILSKEAEII